MVDNNMHSDRLKVLCAGNLYPNAKEPNRGIFVKQIIDELNKICDVQVVAPLPWFPFKMNALPQWSIHVDTSYEEIVDDVKVYHPRWLIIPKIFRPLNGFFMFFSLFPALIRIRKQYHFEVIYAHWIFPDGFAAVLCGKLLNVPVVLHAHGCDINQYTKYFFRRMLIKWAINNSSSIISVSRALGNRITELGVPEKKIRFIPNGINSELFKAMDQYECRRALGLDPEVPHVLFIGSLEEVKGVPYLIEAFHTLKEKYGSRARLLMIGSGPMKEYIREQFTARKIDKDVHLAGQIPHSQIPLWMNAANVLCLPSIREGMPNVILEALGCGCYVVASAVGGIPEIITSEDRGILVPARDPQLLAEALNRAINKKHNKNGTAVFTWENNAKEIHDLLGMATLMKGITS